MGKEITIDCVRCPLGVVDALFNSASCNVSRSSDLAAWDWGVKDYFNKFLERDSAYSQIPEINSVSLGAIPTNTLVRFRGMVQDMLENEFYVGCYQDGESIRTTKYTDNLTLDLTATSGENFELWERRTLYCVPVPGENNWVKEALASTEHSLTHLEFSPSKHSAQAYKRQLEEGQANSGEVMELETDEAGDSKRRRLEPSWMDDAVCSLDLNFPLGEGSFRANPLRPCVVKVYNSEDSNIMLNDVIDVIGIYTFDPELSANSLRKGDDDLNSFIEGDMCLRLPQSRVPRLHCVTMRKLVPNNVISVLPELRMRQAQLLAVQGVVKDLRSTLLHGLTNLLLGDGLAAEYLLLHLLSQIHKRVDAVVLGPVSLNITLPSMSENTVVASEIAAAVKQLLPYSHLLSLSCDVLNGTSWVPRKDYEQNRLATGILQLPASTHLTVDLTCMTEGTLSSTGVQNLCTLKNVIKFQSLSYDFKYHQLEIRTDISVLVISNSARNLVPTDVCVPLVPSSSGPSIPLDKELDNLRLYLSAVRNLDYDQGTSLNEVLENDLVQAMQRDRTMYVESFHRWLTLARLHTISYGESTLKLEHWKKVLEMERLRLSRGSY